MMKKKKSVKRKTKKEIRDENQERWNMAVAEVGAHPATGQPKRLVKLPRGWKEFSEEDRLFLLTKLDVEKVALNKRAAAAKHPGNKFQERVQDLYNEIASDRLRVKYCDDIWRAIGEVAHGISALHEESMHDWIKMDQRLEQTRGTLSRTVGAVINIGRGIQMAFDNGTIVGAATSGDCCPECGSDDIVVEGMADPEDVEETEEDDDAE